MAGRAAVVIGINYETQVEGSGSRAGLTRLRYADAQDVADDRGSSTAGRQSKWRT